ncbi:MAG: DUF2179 domain-containing protein [Firmicutes bacterium]|nr:DUF2179 domain-containing protein [Bacillota bacterium]
MDGALITALLIFVARVLDVSMGTIRMLMLVKGKRVSASLVGFFEVIIFVVALGRVVNELDRWDFILVYALGFATGNLVGSWFEERMALGHIGVQIVTNSESDSFVSTLREAGYGVTLTEGWGKDGPKDILTVILPRRQLPRLMQVVSSHEQRAFTIVMDARKTLGGYYQRQRQKSK